jgi:pyruvate kinase
MISNTGSTPTLHGANITLDMVKRTTDVGSRRTKIVCTLGPACWSEEGLAALMDSGMNVARFNFSHGDHAGHGQVLDRLRKVAAEKSRNIGTDSIHTTTERNRVRCKLNLTLPSCFFRSVA